MKKKLLSLALALAMCLSLAVPALAEEANEALIEEGNKAIQVNYEKTEAYGNLILYKGSVYNDHVGAYRFGGYNFIQEGTSITVENAGAESSAYIYVYYQQYNLHKEDDIMDGIVMQGQYYGGTGDYYLSPHGSTSVYDYDLVKSAGNGQYWHWIEEMNHILVDMEKDAVLLHSGESTTFTLPSSDQDTIYLLYTVCYFPDADYYVWKSHPIKYGSAGSFEFPGEAETVPVPEISAEGIQTGTTVTLDVTLTDAVFDATEAIKAENWTVANDIPINSVVLSSGNTKATLTLTTSLTLTNVTVSVSTATLTDDSFVDDDRLWCAATITPADSAPAEPETVTPVVTATPATAAVGDTTVVVLLDARNGTFSYGRLHDAMGAGVEYFFNIDAGTTGLVLTDVEPVQPYPTAALYQAKLTFTANGGAQAGTLKITPLAFSFESNGKQPTDANTVTVTVSGGSAPDTSTPPLVFPDIPYIPSTPSTPNTSTGGSNTTTKPSTSTTTTPTPTPAPTSTTVTNPDGSTTTTRPDGTVTTTATDAMGNRTETVANPNGSTVTTVENRDGGTSTTIVSASGQVTATVTVPTAAVTAAQASGQAVTLPMPEVPLTANTAAAPVVTVTTGSSQPVKVEIPVARTTSGTVAVIVNADGTEEVVKTSFATASGVTLTVASGTTVKIVDNSKSFTDTAAHWASDAITFATAHELFNGTSVDSFTPDGTMTRGMMVTVLARYDGVDTTTGATWYEKGVDWAAANNISSGADLDAPVSREQLATMLYRYAAASGLNTTASGSLNGFPDVGSVSDYAADAMAWAVGAGLIGGTDKGELNPGGGATRAEVATILMRFCENVAK